MAPYILILLSIVIGAFIAIYQTKRGWPKYRFSYDPIPHVVGVVCYVTFLGSVMSVAGVFD